MTIIAGGREPFEPGSRRYSSFSRSVSAVLPASRVPRVGRVGVCVGRVELREVGGEDGGVAPECAHHEGCELCT